jgi:hypothetical protein
MRLHAADDGGGLPRARPAYAAAAEGADGLAGADGFPGADALTEAGSLAEDGLRGDGLGEAGGLGEDSPVGDGPVGDEAAGPGVNPLQRLIQQRLRERGWSYGQVARRGGLPRSTVYTLATTRNLVRPPRPATINGLARGLDVPVTAVRAAAAESTGLHYYDEPAAGAGSGGQGDQERALLIASIDELSPEDRRHVAALVESLRNRAAPPSDR